MVITLKDRFNGADVETSQIAKQLLYKRVYVRKCDLSVT